MLKKIKQVGVTLECRQAEQKKESRVYYLIDYIIECLCMILLVYGAVCGLFASCGVVQEKKHLMAYILFITAVSFAVFSLREKKFWIMLYLGVCAFFLFMLQEWIWMGAKYFAEHYVVFVNEYFSADLVVNVARKDGLLPKSTCLFAFQLFIGWGLILVTGIFRKIYKKSLVALISPILVFSCIFIVGLIPESQYLFAFLIGGLPFALSSKTKNVALGVQAKTTTLVSTGVLMLICALLMPKAFYQKHYESICSIKRDIQEGKVNQAAKTLTYYFSDMKGPVSGLFSSGYGGMKNGEVGKKDKISFDKKTDFVFTVQDEQIPKGNNEFYLRSFIGSNFNDRAWGGLNEEQQKEYNKLKKQYGENFDQILTDMLKLDNLYSGVNDDDGFTPFLIEKKDIVRSQMLLPYGLDDNVIERNGKLYTKDSFKKRLYKEKMHKDAMVSPFGDGGTTGAYEDDTLFGIQRFLMYQYEEVIQDSSSSDLEGVEVNEEEFYKELEKFVEKETHYRKFVRDTYTKLPDGVASLTRKKFDLYKCLSDYCLIDENSDNFVDFSSRNELDFYIYICKSFMNKNAYYSLEPGAVPNDKDLIDYFLFENKKGYCTYFATAATILLRAQGVPARYVEGYKITSDDFARKGKRIEIDNKPAYRLDVTDEQAHAWVEVYLNGCGWLPVEVTPGRGPDGAIKVNNNKKKEEEINNSAKPPVPSIMPSLSSPKASSETTASLSPKSPNRGSKVGNGKQVDGISVREYIVWGFFLLAVIVGVVLRRWLIMYKKQKKEYQSDSNGRVLFYYQEVDRMTSEYCKKQRSKELREDLEGISHSFNEISLEDFQLFITIVEKATFGRSPVSDYECIKCKMLYDNVRTEMYRKSSFIQRLYYKVCRVF